GAGASPGAAPTRPAPSPSAAPTRAGAARATGTGPAGSVQPRPGRAATGDLSPPNQKRPPGPQASVYLLDGTFARGFLPNFDSRASTIDLIFDNGGQNRYPLKKIMAVFLRVEAGRAPTPAKGTSVTVRLVNDREILGVTPDYEPGGMALTVVPEPRRGTDRVWIPAWAVKAIEMD
ncbi:MAG: hypothetical protein AAFV29_09870, partial [Myxococcota bacterium]